MVLYNYTKIYTYGELWIMHAYANKGGPNANVIFSLDRKMALEDWFKAQVDLLVDSETIVVMTFTEWSHQCTAIR